jgi:queuine/archaeosine tRNA-ribosyltransferase
MKQIRAAIAEDRYQEFLNKFLKEYGSDLYMGESIAI